MSTNIVILKGNIGADPVVKTFDSGGKICTFSLATSEKWTSKSGEKVERTDWHNCQFSGALCDVIEKYFKKGDQILVQGKVTYREYTDKEGKKQWFTEIKCFSFDFCGSAKGESKTNSIENNEGKWVGKKEVKATSSVDELPGNIDEDLPF
jgi:single-strand DNA-binding protein